MTILQVALKSAAKQETKAHRTAALTARMTMHDQALRVVDVTVANTFVRTKNSRHDTSRREYTNHSLFCQNMLK